MLIFIFEGQAMLAWSCSHTISAAEARREKFAPIGQTLICLVHYSLVAEATPVRARTRQTTWIMMFIVTNGIAKLYVLSQCGELLCPMERMLWFYRTPPLPIVTQDCHKMHFALCLCNNHPSWHRRLNVWGLKPCYTVYSAIIRTCCVQQYFYQNRQTIFTGKICYFV